MTAKTLADMTSADRVGMWCEDQDGDLLILECVYETYVSVFHPPSGDRLRYLASELTPRFDLPRAWTPAGEPADMDVETGRVEYGRIWYGSEIMERTNLPDGTTVHRYVTDWEEA